jgi:hypothetical protein
MDPEGAPPEFMVKFTRAASPDERRIDFGNTEVAQNWILARTANQDLGEIQEWVLGTRM